MKNRLTGFSRRPACALTLVEVLTGLALLGTVLVSIIVARGQMAVQTRRAEERIEGCRVLAALLDDWWSSRAGVPREAGGDAASGWRWRTRSKSAPEAQALDAQVVAVEVFRADSTDRRPAARVELLVRDERDKKRVNGP